MGDNGQVNQRHLAGCFGPRLLDQAATDRKQQTGCGSVQQPIRHPTGPSMLARAIVLPMTRRRFSPCLWGIQGREGHRAGAGLRIPEQSSIGSIPVSLLRTASGHELRILSGAQYRSRAALCRAGLIVIDQHVSVSHPLPGDRLAAWRGRARISRRLALASLLSPPCRQLPLRFPKGASARPPCSLHRPLRLFPIRLHGTPLRVRAPHRGMAAKALVRSINGLAPPQGDSRRNFMRSIP